MKWSKGRVRVRFEKGLQKTVTIPAIVSPPFAIHGPAYSNAARRETHVETNSYVLTLIKSGLRIGKAMPFKKDQKRIAEALKQFNFDRPWPQAVREHTEEKIKKAIQEAGGKV